MRKRTKKLAIFLLLAVVLVYLYNALGIGQYLTLSYLKSQQDVLSNYYGRHPLIFEGVYFSVYVLVTAFSIPAATVLTLIGGALFGLVAGTVMVSFASTIGATCAFLIARIFARDFFEAKFNRQFIRINDGIKREGAFYLFALRLVPVFPFFLINICMGLTKMKPLRFFIVSQLGMLPGTIIYVNAGKELGQIDSVRSILSPQIIIAFALLGVFPLLAKWVLTFLRHRKILKPFKKPKKFDYNVVVIGAGAAGLVASYIAATLKAKVALVEKNKMGGDCLNTGCVPSKALIRTTRFLADAKRAGELGLKDFNPKVDFQKVMERVHEKIKTIAPHDSVERYTKLGVSCIEGEAVIKSPYEVIVGKKKLTTKNIIIASGGRPVVPDLPGIESVNYYTSDTIWGVEQLPKKLLVLGGGPIGCELGQCFARLGSKVTIIQRANQLLPKEDIEIGEVLKRRFVAEGIDVLTGHEATEFKKNKLICICDGLKVEVDCETVLVALGRVPSLNQMGLDELGLQRDEDGCIAIDPFLRTNFPNIYVCGDVAGLYQFTHAASHQAWYASVNALFRPWAKFRLNNRVIPWCTFTDPEVARVGLNEKDAMGQGIKYEITEYDISSLDRAIVDSNTQGVIRVLTRPESDRILGVTIMGVHAGEMISEFILAMKHRIGLNKILRTIHIYPTYAEANKYAAGIWKKNHAPQWAFKWLKRWHKFNRR